MRRTLITSLLTVLIVSLYYMDITTEADVFLFWCGAIVLVCAIILLTIISYSKTEDSKRLK